MFYFIWKENGEEKCVIETRSRGKAEDCNGHCTQTCTVTPIKFDSCTGDIEALAQGTAIYNMFTKVPFPFEAYM